MSEQSNNSNSKDGDGPEICQRCLKAVSGTHPCVPSALVAEIEAERNDWHAQAIGYRKENERLQAELTDVRRRITCAIEVYNLSERGRPSGMAAGPYEAQVVRDMVGALAGDKIATTLQVLHHELMQTFGSVSPVELVNRLRLLRCALRYPLPPETL